MINLKDLPIKELKGVLDSGKSAAEARKEPVAVDIIVDAQASANIINPVKCALVPEQPEGRVSVRGLAASSAAAPGPDIALVLAGGTIDEVARIAREYSTLGTPVAIIAETSVDAPPIGSLSSGMAPISLIVVTDEASLLDRLGHWVVDSTDKDLAFAANFPFVRPAKVDALITACAVENAAVGAVGLIPGADMPIMTANQAKLALDIAAVYGHDLDPTRLADLAGVVGAGLGYRAVARQALTFVPVFGWALKAGMGYAGTKVTGEALRKRFEIESDLTSGGA